MSAASPTRSIKPTSRRPIPRRFRRSVHGRRATTARRRPHSTTSTDGKGTGESETYLTARRPS
jgi:hypothetical protein